jgi:hypothetical protein
VEAPGLTYVLPLRADAPRPDLTGYLRWLRDHAEVVIVDGSPPAVFAAHHTRWDGVTHVPVDADLVTPMGKVGGVLTGVRRASHGAVVIADDDVRYDAEGLAAVRRLLDTAEVVIPQNHFVPAPWHARWDTARSLIARATGGDWPGTIAVDRDALRSAGGYRGDVMFENLELVRTLRAAGGRVRRAPEIFVTRRPPTTSQFRHQRVRQAYDELARPGRLAVELGLLPAAVLGGRRAVIALALAGIALAEVGRRRHGGTHVFASTAALWAPCWLAERSVTVWLAVIRRVLGGVPYRGVRLQAAATPPRELRLRVRAMVRARP